MSNSTNLQTLRQQIREDQPGIWRYRDLSGIPGHIEAVSLGEGRTPLVPVDTDWLGSANVLLKNEAANPTWSHKDRLASVGVSAARAAGADTVMVASTGNQGAAAAAYSAAAGLRCVVLTTTDVPEMMKTLMTSYGAQLFALPRPDDRWTLMQQAIQTYGWFPLSGFVHPPVGSNPKAIPGYMSLAFEIFEQLGGGVPDAVVIPTAHGDTLAGMWAGFERLHDLVGTPLPRLYAVEPYGSLETTLRDGAGSPVSIHEGRTRAFSISSRTGTPQSLRVLRASKGGAIRVADSAMQDAQRELGRSGFFVEPSSAMGAAAIPLLIERGQIKKEETTVFLSTSTGLKDPEFAQEWLPQVIKIGPDLDELARHSTEYLAM